VGSIVAIVIPRLKFFVLRVTDIASRSGPLTYEAVAQTTGHQHCASHRLIINSGDLGSFEGDLSRG
jgi:hypothetical protein